MSPYQTNKLTDQKVISNKKGAPENKTKLLTCMHTDIYPTHSVHLWLIVVTAKEKQAVRRFHWNKDMVKWNTGILTLQLLLQITSLMNCLLAT